MHCKHVRRMSPPHTYFPSAETQRRSSARTRTQRAGAEGLRRSDCSTVNLKVAAASSSPPSAESCSTQPQSSLTDGSMPEPEIPPTHPRWGKCRALHHPGRGRLGGGGGRGAGALLGSISPEGVLGKMLLTCRSD